MSTALTRRLKSASVGGGCSVGLTTSNNLPCGVVGFILQRICKTLIKTDTVPTLRPASASTSALPGTKLPRASSSMLTLGLHWRKDQHGFEARSLGSESRSRVLMATPGLAISHRRQGFTFAHLPHVGFLLRLYFFIHTESSSHCCPSGQKLPSRLWSNGGASDFRSEGWEFEPLWPH